MPSEQARRRWKVCRRWFRWCRIAALLVVLSVTGVVSVLNQVGLPAFLKNQLEEELRARGIHLRFERARLVGFGLIKAERVRWQLEEDAGPISIEVGEIELELNLAALRRLEAKVDSLLIRGAKMAWARGAQGGDDPFSLADVTLAVGFGGSDRWELQYLRGRVGKAQVRVSGLLEHAPAARKWFVTTPGAPKEPKRMDWWPPVRNLLESIDAPEAPLLDVTFTGDGRDPASLRVRADFRLSRAQSPDGRLQSVYAAARVGPAGTNSQLLRLGLDVTMREGHMGRAGLENLRMGGGLRFDPRGWRVIDGAWDATLARLVMPDLDLRSLKARAVTAPTGEAGQIRTSVQVDGGRLEWKQMALQSAHLDGEVSHRMTNLGQAQVGFRLRATNFASVYGGMRSMELSGEGRRLADAQAPRETVGWGFWQRLAPYALKWRLGMSGIEASQLEVESVAGAGSWEGGEVAVEELRALFQGEELKASAKMSVGTRVLTAEASSSLDAHKLEEALGPAARRWLGQFTWEKAPRVTGRATVTFPPWDEPKPDWRAVLLNDLAASGQFECGRAAFRGVPVESARSHFSYAEGVWRLPDLEARRTEGKALVEYVGSNLTQDYYWRIESGIDLRVVGPLLGEKAEDQLGRVEYEVPPTVRGEIWGRWGAKERTGFRGELSATNISYRGELCTLARTRFAYTNLVLQFDDGFLSRGKQQVTIPRAIYDLDLGVIDVTNVVSNFDPTVVTKWIGPKTYAAIEPYKFREPPNIRLNGRLPTREIEKVNARFEVEGNDFSYWKFNVPKISGNIHWHDEALEITNVHAAFYDGKLVWSGNFDFSPPTGSDFNFLAEVQEANFQKLMADLSPNTKKLEGTVHGRLRITSANSANWKSWQGGGDAHLRDGFLWGVPVFGFFTPMLNRLSPGLGESRVTAGDGTFTIDKSVIQTQDLEVKASTVRLKYTGTVDFDGALDARVQAEMLRDTWAVGRMVNLALWPITKLFEYKVGGNLQEPKSELLHIPAFFTWPLHPWKTFKELVAPGGKKGKDEP